MIITLLVICIVACSAARSSRSEAALGASGGTQQSQDAVSTPELLAMIDKYESRDPWRVIRIVEPLVAAKPRRERAQLLEALANVYSLVKQPARASILRRQSLAARGKETTVADFVTTYAALAQDALDDGKYAEALTLLDKAGSTYKLDTASNALIVELRSRAHTCVGEHAAALSRFDEARELKRQAGIQPPSRRDARVNEVLNHIDLLQRALLSASGPSEELPRMQASLQQLTGMLTSAGPWTTPLQLPKQYIPGLAASPWHSAAREYPQLKPVIRELIDAAPALREEYVRLRDGGLLYRQTECIHDPSRGGWTHYSINGFWLPRRDGHGCSEDTPVACALMQRVRGMNVTHLAPLRAGYSAVTSRAHILPHYGISNAQLKFHLGLIVPKQADGSPCARMRVGNETRAWVQDGVLFFDDSWVHEVWNDCDAERVVLQFVFVHPDMEAGRSRSKSADGDEYAHAMQALMGAH